MWIRLAESASRKLKEVINVKVQDDHVVDGCLVKSLRPNGQLPLEMILIKEVEHAPINGSWIVSQRVT